MKTYYDILGVVPAVNSIELAEAYKEGVFEQFEEPGCGPQRFEHATSMWRAERIDKIAELTAAYQAINNGDRRQAYNRKLMKDALICPVCEGRGMIVPNGITSIQCAACRGTGKGVGSYE